MAWYSWSHCHADVKTKELRNAVVLIGEGVWCYTMTELLFVLYDSVVVWVDWY